VNISSIGGKIGQPFAAAYIASKHGLEGFSDAVRRELQLYGIAVIIVAPAEVRTPIWDKIEPLLGRYAGSDYGEAYDRGLRTMITIGRGHGLEPKQVAETIWQALTAAQPDTRYAPARHPVVEQGLLRILPRRFID
jgi:short-subunit dehydrogenase